MELDHGIHIVMYSVLFLKPGMTHMTGEAKMFTTLDDEAAGYDNIMFGDNGKGEVKGLGKIAISNDYSLSDVLLVDSLKYNLLSITQLCDLGYKCTFTSDGVELTTLDGKNCILKGFRNDNLYLVDFSSSQANLVSCLFSKT
jgi:hypothetical protein